MNLGAYYVVGIPCAIIFAFVFHIGGMVGIFVANSDCWRQYLLLNLCFLFVFVCSCSLKLKLVLAGTLDRNHMCTFCSRDSPDYSKCLHRLG